MKNPKLQLLLRGENISIFSKITINYPGITINKISKAENKDCLFVDITISSATKPGKFKIILSGVGLPNEDVNYELKARSKENGKTRAQGVTAKDFTYLIMPDRFANGEPSNDNNEGYTA